MAGSVNKVILVGNLGADPEVKSFQNGGRIANLRIATSEDWKDRQTGEKRERTEWHQVVLQSDGLVGVAERFLRKGSKVFVEGKLQTRKWQNQSGQDQYTTEIRGFEMQMLDGKQDGQQQAPRQQAQQKPTHAGNQQASRQEPEGETDYDDDIPF